MTGKQTRIQPSLTWHRVQQRTRPRRHWQRAFTAMLTWRGFAQLCCALYLALYLVAANPLTQQVWLRGGHATPEQWAYHTLLERMGIVHHHGAGVVRTHGDSGLYVHLSPEDIQTLDPRVLRDLPRVLALLPLPTATVTAPVPLALALETTLHLMSTLLLDHAPPAASAHLERHDLPCLVGITVAPLEKPPSSQS